MATHSYSHTVDSDDGYEWIIVDDGLGSFVVDTLIFNEDNGERVEFPSPKLHTVLQRYTGEPCLAFYHSAFPSSRIPFHMLLPPDYEKTAPVYTGGCTYAD